MEGFLKEPGGRALVEMRGIRKSFPGVLALDNVSLDLAAGEVHVMLGENGAGKSTLMKVLAGVHQADAGEVRLGGVPVLPKSVLEAQRQGIVMVMQEFNLIPDLTAAENVALVNRPEGPLLGLVRRREMEAEAAGIFERLGIRVRPDAVVRGLSVAEKQMVEIAKAMSLSARVLILDEPTAALSDQEVSKLFDLIRELKSRGLAVVYISHRFEEIFTVGDRVTVLRDGRFVNTYRLSEVESAQLIRDMAGRELSEMYPRRRVEPGETVLEVRGLCSGAKVRDASLELRRGEVVGLGGLMGAGRTELGKAVFGALPSSAGEVKIFGKNARINSPRDAIALGLAYCTEDRKDEGLFLEQSVAWNISITDLAAVLRNGLISSKMEAGKAREYIQKLRITPPDETRSVKTLSGGTQQKVALAKWLATRPGILILDEPTRGIDVSAKVEIYNIIDRFVADGGAVILISSDLPEFLAMSDRIVVMREGRVAGECGLSEFSPERIMAMATGVEAGKQD
ncbi:MAG TPA: sugar ABC transporter ATP-binding protein [bacterium]|nr:sugar ABC transporter ATP-binding protein [bacterium]